MASWFTPRRFLVYSAYFVGAFSTIVGLFVSRHVWEIHTTVRLIEKSWDVRGKDYRNVSWVGKASHALLAGHEDVSEYNDLFWAKYHELDTVENVPGSFNRSNLTTCEPGYAPEWADANAGYDKWGFVLYRTDYEEDEKTWAETVQHINHTIRAHLEIEATHHGSECDPDLIRDRAVLEIIEDRETLDGARFEAIQALWRERVDTGLVDSTFKTGGWNWGWFRVNLNVCNRDDDGECKKANGMALNLCLMYDSSTRFMMQLATNGLPAAGPRDPWEPFLLAIDGIWSPDKYMYKTTWAHEYRGSYGVALSILFNDFHGKIFEREMERQAPYMFMGELVKCANDSVIHANWCLLWLGGPVMNPKAPWWHRVLTSMHAVARPGHFPFEDRWQEMSYPFVREDSYWIDPAQPENIQVDGSVTTPQESSALDLTRLLKPSPFTYYTLCSDSDENQKDCFQNGNYRVRPHIIKERVSMNGLKQDALVEQDTDLAEPEEEQSIRTDEPAGAAL
jgi:hypothetical protein